jgi:SPP1 family predicted phage head-tail adaptor
MRCSNKKLKICLADLSRKIKIQVYQATGSDRPNENIKIGFVDLAECFAKTETTSFLSQKNNYVIGANVEQGVNVIFTIRYINIDYKQQLFIEYNGSRYKVVDINDIDKLKEFVIFKTVELGVKEYEINKI